jgi:hypothetical protein
VRFFCRHSRERVLGWVWEVPELTSTWKSLKTMNTQELSKFVSKSLHHLNGTYCNHYMCQATRYYSNTYIPLFEQLLQPRDPILWRTKWLDDDACASSLPLPPSPSFPPPSPLLSPSFPPPSPLPSITPNPLLPYLSPLLPLLPCFEVFCCSVIASFSCAEYHRHLQLPSPRRRWPFALSWHLYPRRYGQY